MKERPILFSGPMVRVILDGRKTQTRRVVKWQEEPFEDEGETWFILKGYYYRTGIVHGIQDGSPIYPHSLKRMMELCPYGVPGDRLWVKETFASNIPGCEEQDGYTYKADHVHPSGDGPDHIKWTPSIHMPRRASRITLEVTDVRVERLQSISHEDAIAEGMTWNGPGDSWNFPQADFATLWNSINGNSPGHTWDDNPWVWVVSFARIRP